LPGASAVEFGVFAVEGEFGFTAPELFVVVGLVGVLEPAVVEPALVVPVLVAAEFVVSELTGPEFTVVGFAVPPFCAGMFVGVGMPAALTHCTPAGVFGVAVGCVVPCSGMGSVVASPGLVGAGGTVVAPGPAALVVIGVGGPMVVGGGAGVVVVAGMGVPVVGAVAGGVAGAAPAPGGGGGGGAVVRPA
jgi:hypothetical protein